MLQLCSDESFNLNVKVNMLLLCVDCDGTSVHLRRNANSFSNHNCPLWLVGCLRVRAETVNKLEACFHGLNLLQQVWGACFFSWRLGRQFRRGGWERKVEFCRRSNFLTWGHHRTDYFFTLGQSWCDCCPRAGKASRVLIFSFPLSGWRSGDRIRRAGPWRPCRPGGGRGGGSAGRWRWQQSRRCLRQSFWPRKALMDNHRSLQLTLPDVLQHSKCGFHA